MMELKWLMELTKTVEALQLALHGNESRKDKVTFYSSGSLQPEAEGFDAARYKFRWLWDKTRGVWVLKFRLKTGWGHTTSAASAVWVSVSPVYVRVPHMLGYTASGVHCEWGKFLSMRKEGPQAQGPRNNSAGQQTGCDKPDQRAGPAWQWNEGCEINFGWTIIVSSLGAFHKGIKK